jgi:hypothetical protein
MHVLAAESGLDHPSGTTPNVAITDNQSIAEQHFDALKPGPFMIFGVATRQYPPDFSRIVDEIREPPVGSFNTDHIAILALQLLQGCQSHSIDAKRYWFIGAWR